ncbi:MAG: hypothetical protein ACXWV8_00520 [Chitinophagaceae bacterium]
MQLKKAVFFTLLIAAACQKKVAEHSAEPGSFAKTPLIKPIVPGMLDEASGIADSKMNPGFLWVEQDSGNPNDIALLSHDGNFFKKVNIKTAANRDWEDIVLANGPVAGTNYIYIADIGDNDFVSSQYHIYRFAEPGIAIDTVRECDKIIYKYPDGAHDAEAILVDNRTKDIYIITKNDTPSRIYKIPYPQSTSTVNTGILCASLSFTGVTGAALSRDGTELLIKTYTNIYYWKLMTGQSVEDALPGTPAMLSYQFEPQGEALCFKNDNAGFFTLSERPSIISAVNLNYYKRN